MKSFVQNSKNNSMFNHFMARCSANANDNSSQERSREKKNLNLMLKMQQ